jgi:hypothetical protein
MSTQVNALTTKLLASQLRARLKNGNAADSAIVEILGRMTDEELVAQYRDPINNQARR